MAKFFFAIVAVAASLALVESLLCNKCSFNLLGVCIGAGNQTCVSSNSVCYTESYTLSIAPDFLYINSTGCRESSASCGAVAGGFASSIAYGVSTACCQTDKCNTVNGAPSTKMTFTAAAAGAILASMWGSFM